MSATQAIRGVAVAGLVVLGVLAAPASATFPGANGQITFFRFEDSTGSAEIWRGNADGTDPLKLYDSGAENGYVDYAWSPSGTRIPFDSDRLFGIDGDVQVFTMDRNGD